MYPNSSTSFLYAKASVSSAEAGMNSRANTVMISLLPFQSVDYRNVSVLGHEIHTVFNRDAAEQSFADGDRYFILGSAQSLNGEHKLEKASP